MWTRLAGACAPGVLLIALLCAPIADARSSNANTAALQVALRALHHYHGGIDGIAGPGTKRAVRRFQRARRLPADGVAGPRTRQALGKRGQPRLGSRVMSAGMRGWDVAALQFMLRRRGYSPGSVDGGFGSGTAAAVKRFQSAAGLGADGHAGKATLSALRHHRTSTGGGPPQGHVPSGAPPITFFRPINAPEGDGFGHPGGRRHDGIDFTAPAGAAVGAAGRGTVSFAGWNSGGYGNLVVVQHRDSYETWYAHLSRFAVSVGTPVAGGIRIGYVGSTGHATGPHLHFEVRYKGKPVNPEPLFLSQSSLKLVVPPSAHARETHELECTGERPKPPRHRPENPANAVLAPC